jgi:hypothetical protein
MTTEAASGMLRQGREAAFCARSGAGEAGTSAPVRLRRAYACRGVSRGRNPRERIPVLTIGAAVGAQRQGREAAVCTRSGAGEAGTSAPVRLRRAYACKGVSRGRNPRERIPALRITVLSE